MKIEISAYLNCLWKVTMPSGIYLEDKEEIFAHQLIMHHFAYISLQSLMKYKVSE